MVISAPGTPTDDVIDGQAITATGTFTLNDGTTGSYVEVGLDTSLGSVTPLLDSGDSVDWDNVVVGTPDAVPQSPPDLPVLPPDPPEKFDIFQQPGIPSGERVLSKNVWTSVGPAPIKQGQTPGESPVTGRITGVAVDPTDSNVIYISAAGGGAWKTRDGGQSWLPLIDDQQTLSTGAIAIAPSNRNVIYVGTGEANRPLCRIQAP